MYSCYCGKDFKDSRFAGFTPCYDVIIGIPEEQFLILSTAGGTAGVMSRTNIPLNNHVI